MMKAKILAGTFGAILLTASVVVGFFQHAAFISQNRGRRHSLSQVVASAGSSGADDLSSLLQTAKSELGISTNYASKAASSAPSSADAVAGAAQSASDSVISAASAAASSADSVVNAVKSSASQSANSAADSVVSAAKSAAEASLSVPPVEQGKAPLLTDFVKGSIKGASPRPSTTSDWSATKANLNLLKDNTIRLTGRDPADMPEIKLPDVSGNVARLNDAMPKISLKELSNDVSKISVDDVKKFSVGAVDGVKKFSLSDIQIPDKFAVSSIQQFVEHLPPATKTLAAVVAGVFLIIGIANNNKTKATVKAASSSDINSTSAKIGGLTDELGTLQSRMKTLEATGLDLDNQLKDAKTKLTQKELDISKARLKAADDSLSLNREIDLLKQKLQENDGKVKALDLELNKARDECNSLVKELEKGKNNQAEKVAGESAKLEQLKKEAIEAKKKEAEEARKMTLEAAKRADEEAKKKKAEAAAAKSAPKKKDLPTADATTPKKEAAPKKARAKKAAAKKTVAEELPTADAPSFAEEAPKQAAPKKKAAAKKTSAKSSDLTTLTKSALSRTTVKVLVEFLDSKGVTTVDENGKTKKKADLIEAVNSL